MLYISLLAYVVSFQLSGLTHILFKPSVGDKLTLAVPSSCKKALDTQISFFMLEGYDKK